MRGAPLLFSRIWPSTFLAGAVLLLSFLLPLPQNGQILGIGSICSFQHLTQIPCPGCGLTRSFVAFAHGQFAQSFVWHPLGPALFLGILVYFTSSLFLSQRPNAPRVSMRAQLAFWLFIVAALMVFWVLRLRGVFPFPAL